LGLALGRGLSPIDEVVGVGGRFLDQLFWVNVSLAVFNLIPAFPMDGGRVLRALLSAWLGHLRATEIAALVATFFAILFALTGLGLLGDSIHPILVLIGLFVYLLGADGLRIIGEVENIGPGLTRDLVLAAPAGTYFTACKPGMVGEGIRGDFTVTDSGETVTNADDAARCRGRCGAGGRRRRSWPPSRW